MAEHRPAPRTVTTLARHTPLHDDCADEAEHGRDLRPLFDDTAPDDDRIARVLARKPG